MFKIIYYTKLGSFGRIKLDKNILAYMDIKKGEKVSYYCENGKIIIEAMPAVCERCRNANTEQLIFQKGHIYCTVCEEFLEKHKNIPGNFENNRLKFMKEI